MEQKQVYWTAEVAKEVEVSAPTINRWTHALEELGYEILTGSEGRAYTWEDIQVFREMKEISQNGPRMKTIEVARQVLCITPGEKYSKGKPKEVAATKEKTDEGLEKINGFIESYQNTILTLTKKIETLEHQMVGDHLLSVREEQMAMWTLEHQIEAKLIKEAEQTWDQLPTSEKEHRVFVGIFPKKVENQEKKKLFILDYVRQRKQTEVVKQWTERQELLKQKVEHQKQKLLNEKKQQDKEVIIEL